VAPNPTCFHSRRSSLVTSPARPLRHRLFGVPADLVLQMGMSRTKILCVPSFRPVHVNSARGRPAHLAHTMFTVAPQPYCGSRSSGLLYCPFRCVLALRAPAFPDRWSTAMFEPHRHAPACVYALADCLDAILATCEDLRSTTSSPNPISPSRLDLAVLALVRQARRCIRELDPLQPGLVHGCANFLVATSSLVIDPPSRPALAEIFLPVGDDHLIAGYVRLGVLAQLAGNLLDILEGHYVLYENEQLIESQSSNQRDCPVERHSHAP
jgi:hypothetical protein